MTSRPTFPDIFMEMAFLVARRSTCSRLQVGTVITSLDHRKVYAIGYNGNASGLPNQCDRSDPGNCGCLHSECNAIVNCDVDRSVPKLVYCTTLSCVNCAKMLINLGGVRVFIYRNLYRITDSLEVFYQGWITTHQLQKEIL